MDKYYVKRINDDIYGVYERETRKLVDSTSAYEGVTAFQRALKIKKYLEKDE